MHKIYKKSIITDAKLCGGGKPKEYFDQEIFSQSCKRLLHFVHNFNNRSEDGIWGQILVDMGYPNNHRMELKRNNLRLMFLTNKKNILHLQLKFISVTGNKYSLRTNHREKRQSPSWLYYGTKWQSRTKLSQASLKTDKDNQTADSVSAHEEHKDTGNEAELEDDRSMKTDPHKVIEVISPLKIMVVEDKTLRPTFW